MKSSLQQEIIKECDAIKEMLLTKNRSYGNSVLRPFNLFSNLSPLEQINVRIDDKLNRLLNRELEDSEDTILDLIGYLILGRIIRNYTEEEKCGK